MPFFSTKRFGPISTGHRQWKDTGHCQYVHGYGRTVKVIFGATELDDKGWVVDFGSLRPFKAWLEGEWDHRTLISSADPKLEELQRMHDLKLLDMNVMDAEQGYGPGIEQSCKYLYDKLMSMLKPVHGERCWVESIEIWEHENNSAKLVMGNPFTNRAS